MSDFELTDLLIELEEIQRDPASSLARGRELADILALYDIPTHLYTLKTEAPAHDVPGRRTLALFNFGLVEAKHRSSLVECLFMIGHSPEFISEAMGESIHSVVNSLKSLVKQHRAQKAAELRDNPQRFRLV
jgi:hypothetical protein